MCLIEFVPITAENPSRRVLASRIESPAIPSLRTGLTIGRPGQKGGSTAARVPKWVPRQTTAFEPADETMMRQDWVGRGRWVKVVERGNSGRLTATSALGQLQTFPPLPSETRRFTPKRRSDCGFRAISPPIPR